MSKDKPAQAKPIEAAKPSWWGVQNDKGEWAFGGGRIVAYQCKAIAEAHAETLGGRWKAAGFGA